MLTTTFARLQSAWQRAHQRLSGDRGSYGTDAAVTTAVLVTGAIIIGGIIILFGEDIANSLQFGPSAP